MAATEAPQIRLTAEGEALSAEQRYAVVQFAIGMGVMGEAMAALEAAGIDAGLALRSIQGPEEGTTMLDALPPAIRMLLG